MRRTYYLIGALLAVVTGLVIGCENPFDSLDLDKYGLGSVSAEIMAVQFGYETEVEGGDRGFDHGDELFGTENFVSFMDTASINAARKMNSTMLNADLELPDNRIEFPEGNELLVHFDFLVQAYPNGVKVNNIKVESSDPSVLEIVRLEGKKVYAIPHMLGDVNVKVTVVGDKNTVINVYPIRIVKVVNIDFYITAFWKRYLANTKIRYKLCNLPPGEKELVTEVLDSVSVIGSCRYYDFTRSRNPFVAHDTIRLERHDKVDRFRKNKRKVLRDITSAIRSMRDSSILGNCYARDSVGNYLYDETGEHLLEEKRYYFSVDKVILDFLVICDNPYIDFTFESKCKRTVETYDGDGELEPEGDIDDNGDDSDVRKLEKSEEKYFQVLLNMFLTKSQRDSLARELNEKLNASGFRDDLPDEEKDKYLEEINKHKKKGED